jgi:hypothetical protein
VLRTVITDGNASITIRPLRVSSIGAVVDQDARASAFVFAVPRLPGAAS